MSDNTISLNKFISQTGISSRREADKWIEAGKVKINKKVASKGNRVGPEDVVTIDGKRIVNKVKPIYIILNKPPGITCTTDISDRTNIINYVNHKERIFPIGRLDKPSTGLIILTNDGDMVNKVLRVENNNEKEYIVTVNKTITAQFLKSMASGVPILGTKTKKCRIQQLGKTAFKITLTQGLNRQIRRMCEFFHYGVISLKRIRIMHIKLGNLKEGDWRNLTKTELSTLRDAVSKNNSN